MPRSGSGESRYLQIVRELFRLHHANHARSFDFSRDELNDIARDLGFAPPKNLGDNIYAIRHGRTELPDDLKALAPRGKSWLLLPTGRGTYRFQAAARNFILPSSTITPTLIPDSTPQILDRYVLNQEQSLLARLAYCRLVDIFLGLAAYRVQSHLRTTVRHFGDSQIEIDDVYVATERTGAHFIIPVQAKGVADNERISCVQLICDYHWSRETFAAAIPRLVAAKILAEERVGPVIVSTIALIEVSVDERFNVAPICEQHFKLVPSAMIKDSDLREYRRAYEGSGVARTGRHSAGKA